MLPFKLSMPPALRSRESRNKARRPARGLSVTCTRPAVSRLHAGGSQNIALELQDLGWGGVRFVAAQPVEAPCPLHIQIRENASGDMLQATGEIAWVRKTEIEGRTMYVVGARFDMILTPPAQCAKFFEGLTAPKPATRTVKAPPKTRSGNRFPISECEVILERDRRSGPKEAMENLATGLLDLSRTGAQVMCSNALQRGDRVRLTVHLTKFQDTFTAEAETVWVRSAPASDRAWKIGVAFGSLDHAQQRKLQSLESWFGHALSRIPKPPAP